MNSLLILFLFLISVGIVLFWAFQLIDMIQSKKIKKTEKGLWILGFIFFSLITAFIWWMVKKK